MVFKSKYILLLLLILIIAYYFYLINIGTNNTNNTNNTVMYVFWTGGYDSTFRICQALIDENRTVQPIYISDIIDNLPENPTRRKNREQEYNAMEKIRADLALKYPYTKKTFLKLLDIKNIPIDNDIANHMKTLKQQKRVRRAVCQYGAMAQATRNLNKNIEICVENEPGSMLNKTMKGQLLCNGSICTLKSNLKVDDESLKIFDRFVFSTIKLTKKDMLNIAKKSGYEDILGLTWSCWYPNNGNPCGKCIMCHERII
jgi:hypothetical protein